ncbi:MAG: hypothetical protein SPH68_00010 [Candidatus Borkfalkiaceae bacterium]|nr:hypothetical protein [Clostridia bacterium]MDY6222531.1 hypothetical protein [Christensenellaceae bacterium]
MPHYVGFLIKSLKYTCYTCAVSRSAPKNASFARGNALQNSRFTFSET